MPRKRFILGVTYIIWKAEKFNFELSATWGSEVKVRSSCGHRCLSFRSCSESRSPRTRNTDDVWGSEKVNITVKIANSLFLLLFVCLVFVVLSRPSNDERRLLKGQSSLFTPWTHFLIISRSNLLSTLNPGSFNCPGASYAGTISSHGPISL